MPFRDRVVPEREELPTFRELAEIVDDSSEPFKEMSPATCKLAGSVGLGEVLMATLWLMVSTMKVDDPVVS